MINYVLKRNGVLEQFDIEKIKGWIVFGFRNRKNSEDLIDEVLSRVLLDLYDGISTKDIQLSCINVCLSYSTEEFSNIASMFLIGNVYKEVGIDIVDGKPVVDFVKRYKSLIKSKAWSNLDKFTESDIVKLSQIIDYNVDFTYEYASLKRWYDSIARRDATTNIVCELPQETWMGVSMASCMPNDTYLKDTVDFYGYTKTREINIPTPIAVNFRTGKSNGVSCCVVTAGDTLDSIATANYMTYMMTARGAGIGMNYECRSLGDVVGNNKCTHSGKLAQYKMTKASISSVSQGSRGGAITINYSCLDPEYFDLLNARLPTTVETARLNTVDYAISVNDSFLRAVNRNLPWLFVSIKDAPLLHKLLLSPNTELFDIEFDRVKKLIKNGSIKGTIVNARDMGFSALQVVIGTGNVYWVNLTNTNRYTPYNEPIRSSNLCNEIALPTRPYGKITELNEPFDSTKGLTALCFLMAIDSGKVLDNSKDFDDFVDRYMKIAYVVMKAVDNNIDSLDYPNRNLRESAKYYRSVGIGITNFAYYLASQGIKYSSLEGRNAAHVLAELHYYSLCNASMQLSKERGKCGAFDDSKMSKGILAIDNYARYVDTVHTQKPLLDWESLRKNVIQYGTRHSCFVSHMPSEQSSKIGNSYKSILPMRDGIIHQADSKNTTLFIGPRYEELKEFYEQAFTIKTKDLYSMYGVFQKFSDQSCSLDTFIDLSKLTNMKVSFTQYTSDLLHGFAVGIKGFYYVHTVDGETDTDNIKQEVCINCDV